MHFPMYTVPANVLLKMTRVEPHEMLKAAALWSQDMLGHFIEGLYTFALL